MVDRLYVSQCLLDLMSDPMLVNFGQVVQGIN